MKDPQKYPSDTATKLGRISKTLVRVFSWAEFSQKSKRRCTTVADQNGDSRT